MTTARDIIKSALRKISVIGAGQTLDSTEANDALNNLNAMLAVWSIKGNMIYTESRETFTLTTAGSYTIGSGADFDTVRPIRIVTAYVTSNGTDYPLTIINETQYAKISDKTQTGTPSYIFYDGNYPEATIKLWPVPSNVQSITIYSEKPLSEFASLDTVYSMPPEYRQALENNLAVHIAPEYEKEASQTIKSIAMETLSLIRSQNTKNNPPRSTIDAPRIPRASNNYYDVYRGY